VPQLRRAREAARLGQADEVLEPLGLHGGQCSQRASGQDQTNPSCAASA
jgi:hypothetical protein